MKISRRQLRAFIATAIATAAVILMLSGCMTSHAADLKRRNPHIRLVWYEGRLTYFIGNDPYNIPLEIVRQMTEEEYRIWMETLREMGR